MLLALVLSACDSDDPDVVPPVVALNGAAVMTVSYRDGFSDPGATARDDRDGTVPVTVTGEVPPEAGEYTLTYTATDAAGNTGRATRTVRVVDDVPPVVTLNGDAVIAVSYAAPLTDPGATATDEHDGALAVTVSGNLGTDIGEYTLIYSATDAAGNVGQVERTVRVVDDVPPVIMLNGPASSVLERDEPYLEPGAVAEDEIDGPVETTVTGEVSEAAGEYTLVYRATDAAGNVAEVRRTVTRAPGDYMLEVDVFGEGEVLLAAGLATTPFECEDGRCFGRFEEGERVELEAYAGSGRKFNGWGMDGVCDETPSPQRCVLVMDRDRIALPAFVSEAPLTLHDDVVVLTPDQLEGLVFWAPDAGVAAFDAWTDLNALVPGTVMVSYGAPDEDGFPTAPMFLARVLSVAPSPDGSQLVTTLPAGLDDLYASGTLMARAELTQAALSRAKLAPGVKLTLARDKLAPGIEADAGPSPQGSQHECTFTPDDNGPLTDICVTLRPNAVAMWEDDEKLVLLDLGAGASVTIREGTVEGRIWLATIPLPTTALGVFVALNLYLKPGVGLTGDFSLPVAADATLVIGASYKKRKGSNIIPIYDWGVAPEVGPLEGEITGANVQLGVEAAAIATVFGAVGVEMSGTPYFGASLEQGDCTLAVRPYWGVDVGARFFLRIWKFGWGSRSFDESTGDEYIEDLERQIPLPSCGGTTPPPSEPQPPMPPRDLHASLADARDVQLRWLPSDDGVTSFRVYRGGRRIETTPRTTHLDLAPPIDTHCYTVRAVNQAGWSAHSHEACVTVPAREDPPRPARPAKPVVELSDETSRSANLSWTEEDGVDYWLWFNDSANGWIDAGRAYSPHPVRPVPGRRTCYRVRAQNSAGTHDSDSRCVTPAGDNAPPTANAGEDFSLVSGASWTLTGSGTDPDGRVVGYSWRQTAGPDVLLRDASHPEASFAAPETDAETRLTFRLTVTDDDGATHSDTVRVTVWPAGTPGNDEPRAEAGDNQRVTAGSRVTLSGRGSKDDRGIIAWHWVQWSRGPAVTLSGATSRDATFVAPSVSEDTVLKFRLTVTDGHGATDRDNVRVTVSPGNNQPPVADAGSDQSVVSGTAVTLTGSGSDPDGRVVGYAWTQTAGPAVSLSGATATTATFTAPVVSARSALTFRLTVTDDRGATDSATVQVTVSPGANRPPVADAGGDQSVESGAAVTLAGSGSDPDGRVVGYAWTQTGGPTVLLTDASSATATFTAPAVAARTTLIFQLAVTDDDGANGRDEATVTVSPAGVNRPPVADAGGDQSVESGTAVTLAGSGSDPDGRVAGYAWTQTAGQSVALSGASSATATFTAPMVETRTTLTFRLTVTDDDGETDGDDATVTVAPPNRPPVADAGADQSVASGATVTLNGSGSDPDGRVAGYAWMQTGGPTVALSGASSATATFTAPPVTAETTLTFRLTVTDDAGATGSDEAAVTVTAEDNTPVNIPDAALRAALLEALGKSAGDTITRSDMAGLTDFAALSRGITNLKGLEVATNLTTLTLTGNSISDVSALGTLTSLTWLFLNVNSISDVSALGTLTSLTWLDLGGNSISDVSALGTLTSLTELELDRNSISDVSALGSLTSLTTLYLQRNSISNVSALGSLTSLTTLELNRNAISDVSGLGTLTSLTRLTLDYNAISDTSGLGTLTSLTRLDLNDNSVSDISGLATLTSLTSLDLNDNSISDAKPLVDNAGLGSGDSINLRRNPLDTDSINTHIPALRARGVGVACSLVDGTDC